MITTVKIPEKCIVCKSTNIVDYDDYGNPLCERHAHLSSDIRVGLSR